MHRKITCFYGYDKASAWESRGFIHFSGMFCNTLPNTHDRQGVAFSDILMYVLTRGDADSLAPLDCQHYHGYSEARPWASFSHFSYFSLRAREIPKDADAS